MTKNTESTSPLEAANPRRSTALDTNGSAPAITRIQNSAKTAAAIILAMIAGDAIGINQHLNNIFDTGDLPAYIERFRTDAVRECQEIVDNSESTMCTRGYLSVTAHDGRSCTWTDRMDEGSTSLTAAGTSVKNSHISFLEIGTPTNDSTIYRAAYNDHGDMHHYPLSPRDPLVREAENAIGRIKAIMAENTALFDPKEYPGCDDTLKKVAE
ncbi:hypothetical protein HOD30_00695 [Candidatus Peregrinibacteria bacterium]|jgi:hypothetical protein|nr:hypothetical protein [Candidatus Peregrinibacteria bacterium]MBT4631942.1 hypothetical protein [Candidatus Peregrinibacteria bacterium]MBT5274915.1 hypothetical protein [Candidatus Woesearchaeota archaeon]MBT5516446.1 hypothetical protein [Candidatus Peregrinibacteria bacterium]MBT5823671.1 hypothetical protein [Candidatus Peregrinibacteria bacterium]